MIEPLTLSITYDSPSDTFQATLPNGAKFQFGPEHVAGKLANNLDLYRSAVKRLQAAETIQPSERAFSSDKAVERERLRREMMGVKITEVGVRPRPQFNLDELDVNP